MPVINLINGSSPQALNPYMNDSSPVTPAQSPNFAAAQSSNINPAMLQKMANMMGGNRDTTTDGMPVGIALPATNFMTQANTGMGTDPALLQQYSSMGTQNGTLNGFNGWGGLKW